MPHALLQHVDDLRIMADRLPQEHAGIRISGIDALSALLSGSGPIGAIAARVLGPVARPVRAILFDKTSATNWSLGWHQDRTICVRAKVDVAGFSPWTIKRGMHHVAPPFDLLARMITLRVHLDDVPASNAPLLVALGSHKVGRISEAAIRQVVRRHVIHTCIAEAGDVWAYATPILHASNAAESPTRRRVLQVDFAAEELPGGLEWLEV